MDDSDNQCEMDNTFACAIDMGSSCFRAFFRDQIGRVIIPIGLWHSEKNVGNDGDGKKDTSVNVYGPSFGSRMDAADDVSTIRRTFGLFHSTYDQSTNMDTIEREARTRTSGSS